MLGRLRYQGIPVYKTWNTFLMEFHTYFHERINDYSLIPSPRYIRRGPKYFRNIGLEVLMEVNLGNADPIETKMIGNVFAFTRHDVEYIEMYALKSPGMREDRIE